MASGTVVRSSHRATLRLGHRVPPGLGRVRGGPGHDPGCQALRRSLRDADGPAWIGSDRIPLGRLTSRAARGVPGKGRHVPRVAIQPHDAHRSLAREGLERPRPAGGRRCVRPRDPAPGPRRRDVSDARVSARREWAAPQRRRSVALCQETARGILNTAHRWPQIMRRTRAIPVPDEHDRSGFGDITPVPPPPEPRAALAAKVAAAPVSPRQRAFTDTATAAEGRAGLQGTPVPGRKGNVPRMPDLGGWVSRQIRIARKRSHARSLR